MDRELECYIEQEKERIIEDNLSIETLEFCQKVAISMCLFYEELIQKKKEGAKCEIK